MLSAGDIRAAWLALPESIHMHASVTPLWDWLAAHTSERIVRPAQEWRSEIWELSKTEGAKTGHGIWLGTMHSVKGLEFDSVIVFAGKPGHQADFCEELRLRYVAMTRAERNLILMQDTGNWFTLLGIEAETLPLEARESGQSSDVFYCGMKDVDIDYAGRLAEAINTSALHENDKLEFNEANGTLRWQQQVIGRLSRNALQQLQQKTKQGWGIKAVRVQAIVRRYRNDASDEQYIALCRQQAWYVILPKILLIYGAYQ